MNMVPMLRPVLFLSAGILAGRYLPLSLWMWLIPLLICTFLTAVFSLKKIITFKSIGLLGAGLMMAFFFGGAALYQVGKLSPIDQDIYQVPLEIKVEKVLKAQPEFTRALGVILSSDTIAGLQGRRVLLMLKKPPKPIFPSDIIRAVGRIQPIPPASNPGQFSLKEYYGHKWVYEQIWLSEESYTIYSPSFSLNPFRYSYLLSLKVRETIQKFVPLRSASTLQAMFLGVKHDISSEMLATYQRAGVMHILAVSGMHVGIIYVGLIFVFGTLIRRRQFWWWFPVAGIWLFTFLTGAGPAVVRAAIMLSLVDIGRRSGNTAHTFNLLLFSAFILLIWQPYLLWDIGFQLSYAAMCGILWFLKPISTVLWFKHQTIHRYLWQPLALSVSAQLGTFPFVMHYFGIFPCVFPLSNILTLLPVLLALWGALLLLISHILLPDVVTILIGRLLDSIIHFGFNVPLQWLSGLPYAYVSQIYFTPLQVCFFCSGIIFLAIWIQNFRSGKWVLWALTSLAGALLAGNISSWVDADRTAPLLLHTKEHTVVMSTVSANKAFLWTDSVLRAHPETAAFDLEGTRKRFGWRYNTHQDNQVAISDETLLVIAGKSILKLHEPLRHYSQDYPVKVDYILLSENIYLDSTRLKAVFPHSTAILDGSLSGRKRNIFRKILDRSGYPYHDTKTDGHLYL